jgi:UDP-N-acetylglucosamine 1-carboxyvinyltransferase
MSKKNSGSDSLKKIGTLIKSLRSQKGLTQESFAQLLKTSQSAVARIESGNQNLTTNEILKIGEVLHRKIISLDKSIDFKVIGGKKLSGTIETNTSKNGAMGLLAASLLNKGTTTLRRVPRIEEVNRVLEIFESIGVSYKWEESTLTIKPPKKFKLNTLDIEAAKKIRSALMMIGSLVHHVDTFKMPHAGGCKMGERTIAAHRYGLEELGVMIDTKADFYNVSKTNLHGGEIVMYEAGDTAVINILLAAAGIEEETCISFASSNYQVQDVCFFLQKLGVKIEGTGTHILKVFGKKDINMNVEFFCAEDPIESMMFISAAIVTNSQLLIKRCPIDFLALELLKLEKMGLKYKKTKRYKSFNECTDLVDITIYPSKLIAPTDKIHALPYPGINTDNLPFFVPIATQAEGQTLIHDWMWENRAIYFTELNRLGANIKLADPHRVFVTGKTPLKATQVVCPPALRPAMIVLIAMLAAPGESILRNVYAIERGYEDIANRLNSIGADIEIV